MFDQMPDSYQFSEADVDAKWALFKREFMDNETLTKEEQEFYYFVNQATRLQCHIRKLPTMGELRKYLHDEAKREEQKHINRMSATYALREQDFTQPVEEGGPMAQFISVAEELRSKSGKYPTVADVRKVMSDEKTKF
jgi:hypothetical protein